MTESTRDCVCTASVAEVLQSDAPVTLLAAASMIFSTPVLARPSAIAEPS